MSAGAGAKGPKSSIQVFSYDFCIMADVCVCVCIASSSRGLCMYGFVFMVWQQVLRCMYNSPLSGLGLIWSHVRVPCGSL